MLDVIFGNCVVFGILYLNSRYAIGFSMYIRIHKFQLPFRWICCLNVDFLGVVGASLLRLGWL